MLSNLHQLLFSDRDTTILAHDSNGNKCIADLKNEVNCVVQLCRDFTDQYFVIACREPWSHLVAMLAAQQLGKTAIFPHNQATLTLKQYQRDAILISDDASVSPDILVDSRMLSNITESRRPIQVDAAACKVDLYTSGSTGFPKKITKSLAVLEREAGVLDDLFGTITDVTHVVGSVSHFHIYGFLFRIVWPLLSGRIFQRQLITNADVLSRLTSPTTALIASPVMLEHLVSEGAEFSAGIVFSSGGPLQYKTSQETRALSGLLPIEIFGSSETGGVAWRRQASLEQDWELLPGISYRQDSERLKIVSPFIDEPGEYVTDDSVSSIDETHFRLLGRQDRVVKLAEKRVSLTAIERSVEMLPEIESAVVITMQNRHRQTVNLVITLSNVGKKIDDMSNSDWWKKIRRHLSQDTESVALPRRIRIIDSIPRNTQGKIDNQQLLELFQSHG
ncbi:AMP-binding protein [Vibrio sp. RC27]